MTTFLTATEVVFATDDARAVRLAFEGADSGVDVVGEERLPGATNYFIGNDPAKWRTNIPTYGKVRYNSVYPGVDLVYYGNERQLEYYFVVAPGAAPIVTSRDRNSMFMPNAIGSTPRMAVTAVSTTGRARSRQVSRMAS